MGNQGFKDLAVWQKAKDLAVLIYRISNHDLKSIDFGLRDQIRRSAVSVASNLPKETNAIPTRKPSDIFFITKGSVAELRTQLQIANESGHLNGTTYETLEKEYATLGKRIGKLIQARRPSPRL